MVCLNKRHTLIKEEMGVKNVLIDNEFPDATSFSALSDRLIRFVGSLVIPTEPLPDAR